MFTYCNLKWFYNRPLMDEKHDLLRKPSKLYGGEANCRRCCQTSEYPSLPTTKLDWIWFYECVFFSRGAPSYVGSTEIFMSTISAGRYQHERPQNIVRRVTAQTSNWVRACVRHPSLHPDHCPTRVWFTVSCMHRGGCIFFLQLFS